MRKEDKLVLSEVLNKHPFLKLIIQEGNWGEFWEEVRNSYNKLPPPGMFGKDIYALFILLFSELNIGKVPKVFPSYGLYKQQDLGNIRIPDGVEQLDTFCFKQATFDSIELPDTLERIDGFAFDSSNLSKISLPDSLEHIGISAFKKCKLSEIKLPPRLTGIGSSCFCENNISEITIPESVEWLGPWSLFNINSGKNYVINIPRKWGKKHAELKESIGYSARSKPQNKTKNQWYFEDDGYSVTINFY